MCWRTSENDAQPGADGSTLRSTWIDPAGDGRLTVGPGEPLVDRSALGDPERLTDELARLVHLADAHVMDASSPARVPFLARLGPPLQSTFRPQETLTAQVLHGAINAVRAFHPAVVIQGGDLIDNDQSNELDHALALLNGGRVHPGSGPRWLLRGAAAHGSRSVLLPPRHRRAPPSRDCSSAQSGPSRAWASAALGCRCWATMTPWWPASSSRARPPRASPSATEQCGTCRRTCSCPPD